MDWEAFILKFSPISLNPNMVDCGGQSQLAGCGFEGFPLEGRL
jgi:hypothetical protein